MLSTIEFLTNNYKLSEVFFLSHNLFGKIFFGKIPSSSYLVMLRGKLLGHGFGSA